MKIGQILKDNQSDVCTKLVKKRKKRRRRRKERYLSFDEMERMMRSNHGIDESKCTGR